MNRNQWLKDYFAFTRKEKIGLLVLIFIILGIWIFPHVTPGKPSPPLTDTNWMTAVKKLEHKDSFSENNIGEDDQKINELVYDKPSTNSVVKPKGQLFYFDPNTLSREGWQKLGIRDKLISTIQNYLNKGGHFYKAEDLKKIYGLHDDEYEKVEPYIKIESVTKKDSNEPSPNNDLRKDQLSKPKYPVIEINNADTSAFIALPGIGNKLAARIVNFRDKLGGFYSINQIGETYGLPDSTFQEIKPFLRLDDPQIKKININTATKDEMKSHPYIKWTLANAIVEYRNQHGNFSSLDDLKKITLITDEIFNKVKFYLEL